MRNSQRSRVEGGRTGARRRRRRRLERLEDMGLEYFRLTRELHARFFNPWPQLLTEGVELLPRFPDLADSEVVLVAKENVELATVRRPITGLRERVANGVVLLPRHVRGRKTDNDAHGGPPRRISRLYRCRISHGARVMGKRNSGRGLDGAPVPRPLRKPRRSQA